MFVCNYISSFVRHGEELKVEVDCNLIKVARLLPTLEGHLEGQAGNWDRGGDVQGLNTPASII